MSLGDKSRGIKLLWEISFSFHSNNAWKRDGACFHSNNAWKRDGAW